MSKERKITNLCLVCQDDKVLLGLKKRGFAEGKWNGFGGKVDGGESIEEAMKREMKEECGLEIVDMEKIGYFEFDAPHFEKIIEVHLFKCLDFSGEPNESEEMLPQWFNINEVPLGKMWPDDAYWYPLFRQGKKFKGKFIFDSNEAIVDYCLYPVQEI